jgi:hypothetical protein
VSWRNTATLAPTPQDAVRSPLTIVEVNCVPLSVVSVEFLLVAALGQPFEHGLTAATDRLHW